MTTGNSQIGECILSVHVPPHDFEAKYETDETWSHYSSFINRLRLFNFLRPELRSLSIIFWLPFLFVLTVERKGTHIDVVDCKIAVCPTCLT